jgi:hypothetical protein
MIPPSTLPPAGRRELALEMWISLIFLIQTEADLLA